MSFPFDVRIGEWNEELISLVFFSYEKITLKICDKFLMCGGKSERYSLGHPLVKLDNSQQNINFPFKTMTYKNFDTIKVTCIDVDKDMRYGVLVTKAGERTITPL